MNPRNLRALAGAVILAAIALAGAGWAGAQQKPAKKAASRARAAVSRATNAAAFMGDPVVKGGGIPNFVPLWTSSSTIGNSIMFQSSSTNVSVSGSLSAGSFVGDGSGVANVNASERGGSLPSAFAQLGISNTFSVDQTISGILTLGSSAENASGNSINNTLVLQGNLTDSSGDQGANVVGGNGPSLPGNRVASGVVGATIAGGGGGLAVPSGGVLSGT